MNLHPSSAHSLTPSNGIQATKENAANTPDNPLNYLYLTKKQLVQSERVIVYNNNTCTMGMFISL